MWYQQVSCKMNYGFLASILISHGVGPLHCNRAYLWVNNLYDKLDINIHFKNIEFEWSHIYYELIVLMFIINWCLRPFGYTS